MLAILSLIEQDLAQDLVFKVSLVRQTIFSQVQHRTECTRPQS